MLRPRDPELRPRHPALAAYGLLLAAGRATRFGGDKLLAPLRGRPLLGHVLERTTEAREAGVLGGGVAVVPDDTGPAAALARSAGLIVVPNPAPEAGLSRSVRLGLDALGPLPAGAAVVLLGDQPGVRLEVLRALVERWRSGGGPVVRPRYEGPRAEPGHPLLIDRSVWPRAAALRGDAGFGPLLRRHPEWVTTVSVAGSNPDIDTPADLAGLEESS